MKLLYLSCHSILEHDELSLFTELGIDYFSLGSYVIPSNPSDKIRPPIQYYPETWLSSPIPPRDDIPKSFIDNFDAIMIMHIPEWIIDNWEKFKHKKVIWRTIGQSTPSVEAKLAQLRKDGLRVVRYSPMERKLNNYIGEDAIIRFYKDPNEFRGWVGAGNEVVTFAQSMKKRGDFCHFNLFERAVAGFNGSLYGNGNEDCGDLSKGYRTYEEMKQKMRDARIYFYTGTQPASYTLSFIEAWMTGVPIVAIGSNLWGDLNQSLHINDDLYEIPQLITNGVNGFYSDDMNELRRYISHLLDDYRSAKRIGEMGREEAIKTFGKESVKLAWKNFFNI